MAVLSPLPPVTHWIGGWVGPRAGLEDVERRKFLHNVQEINSLNSETNSTTLTQHQYTFLGKQTAF
jgi:hypothetical protein